MQCGANVDAKDAYNMTGLHHAAMRGNISVVKFLVSSLGTNQLLNQRDIQVKDLSRSKPASQPERYPGIRFI